MGKIRGNGEKRAEIGKFWKILWKRGEKRLLQWLLRVVSPSPTPPVLPHFGFAMLTGSLSPVGLGSSGHCIAGFGLCMANARWRFIDHNEMRSVNDTSRGQ